MVFTFDSSSLEDYLNDRNLISSFLVSSAVVFLYDWIDMLPEEIEFVWTSNLLRPFNVLYMIQRYMPFIDTIGILFVVSFEQPLDAGVCQVLYNISGWMYVIGIALTEVILTMRTWALWGKGSKLSITLPIFFTCCFVPIFYVFNLFLQTQTFEPSPFPNDLGCIFLGGKPTLFVCWIILLAYEAVILALMLMCYYQSGRWFALSRTVYKEGFTFYIITFLWSIINITVILLLPHDLENLLSSYQRIMHNVLTSRAVLHMRKQSTKSTLAKPGLSVFVNHEQFVSEDIPLRNFGSLNSNAES
ncbi:hypothetical protein F5878DRAFT_630999 [Lentinula raphanica]|uniref:DUF6533 domain-containing protein n=1 Tax=Lentinula raphanica TaxID=153919 RepID=A0AA38P0W4_9AGAR|nr:hypothetical protein F5878DRAFT_630999 [Lentinula raphanica]